MTNALYFVYDAFELIRINAAISFDAFGLKRRHHLWVDNTSGFRDNDLSTLPNSVRQGLLTLGGPDLARNHETLFPSRLIREILFIPHPADRLAREFEYMCAQNEGNDGSRAFELFLRNQPVDRTTRLIAAHLGIRENRYTIDVILSNISDMWCAGSEEQVESFLPILRKKITADTTLPSWILAGSLGTQWIAPSWMTSDLRSSIEDRHEVDYLLHAAAGFTGRRSLDRLEGHGEDE